MTLDALLRTAEREGIKIVYSPFPNTVKGYAIYSGGQGVIYLNAKLKGISSALKTILAEELGHFRTASGSAIVTESSNVSNIAEARKREHQGLSWQAHCLAPLWMIQRAYEDGVTEVWQLAESFEVTPQFMWSRLNSGDVHNMQLKMQKTSVGR